MESLSHPLPFPHPLFNTSTSNGSFFLYAPTSTLFTKEENCSFQKLDSAGPPWQTHCAGCRQACYHASG